MRHWTDKVLATLLPPITALLALLALALLSGNVFAQTPYPSRPISVMVPFAAGGSVDVTARVFMSRLAERVKQPVLIENVAGVAGTIGTQRVVGAQADGYTLLFVPAAPITVRKQVAPATTKYEPLKDLEPVAWVGNSAYVLVARPDFPASGVAEFVKLARAQPGKFNFASDGVGGFLHVLGEIVKHRGKLDMAHVPYKSGPQIVIDMQAGGIDLAVMPYSLVQTQVRAGKIKALAVTSRERFQFLPDVPALAETAEFKGVDFHSWFGLFAPAKTDPAIIERLAKELASIVDEPEIRERMNGVGLLPVKTTRAQFGAMLAREAQDIGAIVAAAGIKAD
ncbi:MAG: Bug family tripartite tricarboxylate transporter substrate binding protein [bacterium]|jgi:tripartite-type tricarboxylate transporter receptor subunit TctC|nr:tripartite tricarboxylate transporter substrate binding protein [Betaproteobacteria bacterium]